MATKTKEVAYVPLDKTNPKVADAPTKIDIPEYPDKGISYAGYAKTSIGNNQYKLTPQTPLDFNSILICSAGQLSVNFQRTNFATTDAYITSMVISAYQAAPTLATATMYVKDGGSNRLIFKEPIATDWLKTFNFDIPLKFSKGNMIALSFGIRAVNDIIVVNFYGWEEE